MKNKLFRSRKDRKISGVCGGIAVMLNMDPTIVRLIFVLASVTFGFVFGGIFIYLLATMIIPQETDYIDV